VILIRCSDDFGGVWIHGIYDKAKGIEVFEAVLDFKPTSVRLSLEEWDTENAGIFTQTRRVVKTARGRNNT
jgi:hypothetical protein